MWLSFFLQNKSTSPRLLLSFFRTIIRESALCFTISEIALGFRPMRNGKIFERIINNYWMRLSILWRIMEIGERVIRRGRWPRRITLSEILIILHMIRKPNSITVLLFIQLIPSLKTWLKHAYLHRSIDVNFIFDSARLGLSSSANILQRADAALRVVFLLFLPCF